MHCSDQPTGPSSPPALSNLLPALADRLEQRGHQQVDPKTLQSDVRAVVAPHFPDRADEMTGKLLNHLPAKAAKNGSECRLYGRRHPQPGGEGMNLSHAPRYVGAPAIAQLQQAAKSPQSLLHRFADVIGRLPDSLMRSVDRLDLATSVARDVHGGATPEAHNAAKVLLDCTPRVHPGDLTTRGAYAAAVRQRATEVSYR